MFAAGSRMLLLFRIAAVFALGACGCQISLGQEVQARAEAMLEHADELSDIRSPNAPPFRLAASFAITDKDLNRVEGSFTEVWVSDTRWRSETVVNNLHRIEVVGATRRWLRNGGETFPERAARVGMELQFLPRAAAKFQFASIDDHSDKDPPYECAVSKRGEHLEVSAFCVDKKSGILIETAVPELRPTKLEESLRPVEHTCSYADFKRFGDFWFPREVECEEDGHKEISIHVTNLTAELSPDPALFTPPESAVELANCHGSLVPPTAITTPQPKSPKLYSDQGRVFVELVVDTKGRPQNVRVVDSGGNKKNDELAVETVQTWHFKPAICDGEAVPSSTMVILEF